MQNFPFLRGLKLTTIVSLTPELDENLEEFADANGIALIHIKVERVRASSSVVLISSLEMFELCETTMFNMPDPGHCSVRSIGCCMVANGMLTCAQFRCIFVYLNFISTGYLSLRTFALLSVSTPFFFSQGFRQHHLEPFARACYTQRNHRPCQPPLLAALF